MASHIKNITTKGKAVAQHGMDTYGQAKEHSLPVRLADDMFWRYKRTNVSLLMGSLAYRIFLFIVPCALIIVALAGYDTSSGGDVGDEVGTKMRLGTAIKSTMTQAGSDAAHGWQFALTLGILGAIVGAYGLFSALFGAFGQVWELPLDVTKKKVKTSARFIVGMILFLGFLYGMAWVRRNGPFYGTVGFVVFIAACMALFWVMSMSLPHRGDNVFNLIPGALAGGAGALALQIGAATWLPNQIASRSQTYGFLGIAVAILVYLAFLGFVLCLVPLVNATFYNYLETSKSPKEIDLRDFTKRFHRGKQSAPKDATSSR